MAPVKTLKRTWCKTCNEFKLHETKKLFDKDWFCKECDTEYTDIYLSEIPEEKLLEQRKRYTESQKRDRIDIYSMLLMGRGLESIGYNSGFGDTEIRESDAGQREIDEIKQMEIELVREKRRVQRQKDLELKQSFHKLGRNDKCLCGSEKKYKKCCYSKIQKI